VAGYLTETKVSTDGLAVEPGAEFRTIVSKGVRVVHSFCLKL